MEHKHSWIELGRVFPFSEADRDPAYLSPEGLHDPKTGELVTPENMSKTLRAHFEKKVPEPTPHIIVQCSTLDCPDGPKHTEHIDLTAAEFKRLSAAYERGALDPDRNGTNRLISQASLDDLGLTRIAEKLSPEGRARSGARETVLELG